MALKRKAVHFDDIVFDSQRRPKKAQLSTKPQLVSPGESQQATTTIKPSPRTKATSSNATQESERFRRFIIGFERDPERQTKTNEYVVYVAKLAVLLESLGCGWDVVQGQVRRIIEGYQKNSPELQQDDNIANSTDMSIVDKPTNSEQRCDDTCLNNTDDRPDKVLERDKPSNNGITGVVEEEETGGQSSLPRKLSKRSQPTSRAPRTLEALRIQVQEKDKSERMSQSWATFQDVVKELGEEDEIKVLEDDYYHIGELVFCRMFGTISKDRLYCLLAECDTRATSSLYDAVQKAEGLAEKLDGAEHPQLASFIRQWRGVINKSAGMKTATTRIQIYVQQYELWKRWMELRGVCQERGPELLRLQDFLKGEGFSTRQGKGVDSCLATYFAKELGLGEGKKFVDLIYGFTALGILVEVLGLGVLVFLPKNIESWYKQLKGGRDRGTFGSQKRKKMQLVCRALVERLPFLRDLCEIAKESIVDRIRVGKNPKVTQALQWIWEGKGKKEVLDLPLLAFVRGIEERDIIEVEQEE